MGYRKLTTCLAGQCHLFEAMIYVKPCLNVKRQLFQNCWTDGIRDDQKILLNVTYVADTDRSELGTTCLQPRSKVEGKVFQYWQLSLLWKWPGSKQTELNRNSDLCSFQKSPQYISSENKMWVERPWDHSHCYFDVAIRFPPSSTCLEIMRYTLLLTWMESLETQNPWGHCFLISLDLHPLWGSLRQIIDFSLQ